MNREGRKRVVEFVFLRGAFDSSVSIVRDSCAGPPFLLCFVLLDNLNSRVFFLHFLCVNRSTNQKDRIDR